MVYNYLVEKQSIFSEKGQETFLKIRDHVLATLKKAGAISMGKASIGTGMDSWGKMACVDRLVELGEIKEISRSQNCPGQYRVFVLKGE